jgi:hypothetical protein
MNNTRNTDTPRKMQGVRSIQRSDMTHDVTSRNLGGVTLGSIEKFYMRDAVNDGKKMFRATPLGHKQDAHDFEFYGQASEYLVDYWNDINLRSYPEVSA